MPGTSLGRFPAWLAPSTGELTRPANCGGGGGAGAQGPLWPGSRGEGPAGAGAGWSGSQLDLNFSLGVQRPSDLLLQQGVRALQRLVLHGQLPEPQLRLLLGHALGEPAQRQRRPRPERPPPLP